VEAEDLRKLCEFLFSSIWYCLCRTVPVVSLGAARDSFHKKASVGILQNVVQGSQGFSSNVAFATCRDLFKPLRFPYLAG